MAEDQKDRFIQYHVEWHQEEFLELALEDFMERLKSLEERMSTFQSQHEELRHELENERKKRKSTERKVRETFRKDWIVTTKNFTGIDVSVCEGKTNRVSPYLRNQTVRKRRINMTAACHNALSTVKLHGHSLWDFICLFFK